MIYFIYKTINQINCMYYIGKHQTNNINDGYLGSGLKLKNAIKKYGVKNFKREIIKYCDTIEELNRIELELINEDVINDKLSYNLAIGGQGGCIVLKKGHPLYESTCRKISENKKQKISTLSSDERKQKFSRSDSLKGRFVSDETKKKMSESAKLVNRSWLKGRFISETTRQKISLANKGRKTSQKTKDLISLNHHNVKGKNNPMFGQKHSQETLLKLSEKAKNRIKIECRHCNKLVDTSNFKRWHGDNCKQKNIQT